MARPKRKIEFSLEVFGPDKLAAALRDPALIEQPLNQVAIAAAELAQEVAVKGLEGRGTGQAARLTASSGAFVQGSYMKYMPMIARVAPVVAKSIERGRKPGSKPEIRPLQVARWLKQWPRGYQQVGRLPRKEQELYWRIAMGIRRRGTKGRFFMKAAREAVRAALPGFLLKFAGVLERDFLRRMQ